MKRIFFVLLSAVIFFSACTQKTEKKSEFVNQDFNFDLAQYVNPFIGTGGHGHTYPGSTYPFGLMQLSPGTRLDGWDGCSGYHYSDSIVYGFSHTALSGTGCSDYGDLLLMPVTGKYYLDNGSKDPENGYNSHFSHDKENAEAGYYSVHLDDYNVDVELTTAQHSGMHKYTFNTDELPFIMMDLRHRDKVKDAYIEKVDDHTVRGYRISQAWASEQYFYFYIEFSEKIKEFGVAENGSIAKGADRLQAEDLISWVGFDAKKDQTVIAKVGMSTVSMDGAKNNLLTEIPDYDFEKLRAENKQAWENELGKINISGATEDEKVIFYTALYHSYVSPNTISDVDGKYRGMDLKVHDAEGANVYTVFSLWDTFRATHPLFTITQQERTLEFIRTFLNQYKQSGRLPVWELCANETDCMIGYHSVSVIADAYMKGLRDYDVELAFEAMKASAEEDHFGLEFYKKFGYIAASQESESVSQTLEYAYDDWCIAVMAKDLGKEDDYKRFIQRAQYWKNIYDEKTRFMRAKMGAAWFAPFHPAEVNFNYTEANAWQYNFFVPQDVNTMIDVMGGDESFVSFLDELFNTSSETSGRHQADITGLIGQYAHGNEPSHHMAYLYNYAGQPWKAQKQVREIMNTMYQNAPDGLSGNEDCGQMSSWYVMSAMGFYAVNPGEPVYIFGTPQFEKVEINLENGKKFTVVADGNSKENMYIQSVTLNGKPYTKSYISHSAVVDGGELIFKMGAEPNKAFASKNEDRPVSVIKDHLIVPVPFIDGEKVFKESAMVELGCIDEKAEVFYSLDGSVPDASSTKYEAPFKIEKDVTVRAVAIRGEEKSFVVEMDFKVLHEKRTLKLKSEYANQYNAGGDNALIDMIRGAENYKTGAWQGYQGIDLEAVVNLGETMNADKLAIGFIQDQKSWIFLPVAVDFYVSKDGKNFNHAGTVKHDIPLEKEGAIVKEFVVEKKFDGIRYVKVKATNLGICPDWHLGAGGKAWIFADEIIVE
jgi:predicted alpha-1,2-mannosidase